MYICVNIEGSFVCVCWIGYKFENDGLVCEKGNVLGYDNGW